MRITLFFILLPFLGMGQTKIGSDINGLTEGENNGRSVSISADGTIVAVGAHLNDNNGTDSGCVRVYKNISGSWIQQGADINGEATGNQSGYSVSLSSDGTTIAIGAPKNNTNGTNSGHVRIYKNIAGVWTQIGNDIDGQTAGDQSGFSVALSADATTVAIGSPYNTNNGNDSGLVRVYKNIAGTWTQQGTDINSGNFYDASGRSVVISSDGTVVAIGAPYNSLNGGYSGRVRVYKNIAGVWTQEGLDIRGVSANNISGFNISMSSDGTTIAIGAIGTGNNSGQVRVFKNIAGEWIQDGNNINGEATNDTAGRSVSISADGTVVVVGADGNDGNGTGSGHARVYKKTAGVWTQVGIDIDGETADENSGFSIALAADGNTVIVGAPYNSTNGTSSGVARVYDIAPLLSSDSFVLSHFNVYPNPAPNILNIQLSDGLTLEKVTLYSNLGQVVKEAKSNTIDVSSLAQGTYYAEVLTNKGKSAKAIIIE
ncbi:T9SS type A sorting domain-containing protein [Flavobacterium terrisoli]|uniref:T9SS type A sorting domain-containing protein n=1 Tax=Flavobacterium terrisoli TaxID=3242195 RepID=UPI00254314A3|nr:T9SS type A sorting domain-containing protein [Flavobacterium buctense]